jgi:hypothetical protein
MQIFIVTKWTKYFLICVDYVLHCSINYSIVHELNLKENHMFTIDNVVDHTTKTAKQIFAHLPNDEVRTGLETLVEAQAAYTKTVFATTTDLVKLATDQFAAFNPAKAAKK